LDRPSLPPSLTSDIAEFTTTWTSRHRHA